MKRKVRVRTRRGIYLLPTVFTVGNLLCGFSSLILASSGQFRTAAVLILLAGVLDALDGRIARLTGTTSEFGVQFDTLADVVSFGIAPAFLSFRWALAPLDRIGWVVCFIFVVCTAMRLARFNIQSSNEDRRFFAGLPSPASAWTIAGVIFAMEQPEPGWVTASYAILVSTLGLLMISRFRYRSFKDLDLRNPRSYVYVLPVAMLLVAVLIQPEWSVLGLGGLYVISGPLGALGGLFGARTEPRSAEEVEIVDGPTSR